MAGGHGTLTILVDLLNIVRSHALPRQQVRIHQVRDDFAVIMAACFAATYGGKGSRPLHLLQMAFLRFFSV